jgi:hypothetical protein
VLLLTRGKVILYSSSATGLLKTKKEITNLKDLFEAYKIHYLVLRQRSEAVFKLTDMLSRLGSRLRS